MLIAMLAAGILLAQAAPAPEPAAVPPAPAAKAEKPKKPKLICEDEARTESFIPRRVCRTPEQIEAERQAARTEADTLQDRVRACRGVSC